MADKTLKCARRTTPPTGGAPEEIRAAGIPMRHDAPEATCSQAMLDGSSHAALAMLLGVGDAIAALLPRSGWPRVRNMLFSPSNN